MQILKDAIFAIICFAFGGWMFYIVELTPIGFVFALFMSILFAVVFNWFYERWEE